MATSAWPLVLATDRRVPDVPGRQELDVLQEPLVALAEYDGVVFDVLVVFGRIGGRLM